MTEAPAFTVIPNRVYPESDYKSADAYRRSIGVGISPWSISAFEWLILQEEARRYPDGRFCEVGTNKHGSASVYFRIMGDSAKATLTTIDVQYSCHPKLPPSTAARWTRLVGPSQLHMPTLQSESFDFIFIDGAHTYEAVLSDASNALCMLAPGGTVMFHDTNWAGVARAIAEVLPPDRVFVLPDTPKKRGIGFFRKDQ